MATDYSARVLSAYLLTGGGGEWYNPGGVFDAFIGDIYAWRAQANATTWGAGPANYAASLIDENQGLALVEGNGAVPWAGATGWGFVAAAAQYFATGLVPANDQSWSGFVQFSGGGAAGQMVEFGMRSGANRAFLVTHYFGANRVIYANGDSNVVIPSLVAGNLGVGGNLGYRNGILDSIPLLAWDDASNHSIYIGARNNTGVADSFTTASIAAAWLCTSNPATVQANALALATAMSQL